MSLTVPSSSDLAAFMRVESLDSEEFADLVLQQAADLLRLATGLEQDPTDEFDLRVATYGILGMAEFLYVTQANKDTAYGPFASERIGNYSYQRASSAITSNTLTGVIWFDQAVSYLSNKDMPSYHTDPPLFTTPDRELEDLNHMRELFPRDFFGR